jgi:hypothetical protein
VVLRHWLCCSGFIETGICFKRVENSVYGSESFIDGILILRFVLEQYYSIYAAMDSILFYLS